MKPISRYNNNFDTNSEIFCECFKSDLGSVDLITIGVGEDEEFLFISHNYAFLWRVIIAISLLVPTRIGGHHVPTPLDV